MKIFRHFGFGRPRSFRSRLMVFAALTSAVAAVLVCATLVISHLLNMQVLINSHLENKGEVIGFNVAATLAFNQPNEAADSLAMLKSVDNLVSAQLFDANGVLFASQAFSTTRDPPDVTPFSHGLHQEAGWIIHVTPVVLNDEQLGTLALTYDSTWIFRQAAMLIIMALLITALGMATAVLVALKLQASLARPVKELISTSRRVAETGDYSISARRLDDDELGELTDAFNNMLSRIRHQASEVQKAGELFRIAVEANTAERKNAEKQLRDREQRLNTLTNAIPAIVWSADSSGRLISLNDQWYEYTGMQRQDPVPPSAADLHVHTDDRAHVIAAWQKAAVAGTPFEEEFRLRRYDGCFRWFLARAVPLRDADGMISGWFGTTTDIEDHKRAQAERDQLLASERAARSEAEHAGRMKDEFVATLSHELRTPLSAILGWLHIIEAEEINNAMVREGLKTIERNARIQAQIIEDLLDMSRIVSGKFYLDVTMVRLPEIIDAALNTIRPAAAFKGIHLEQVIDSRVPPIYGDGNRLQQIVWNLLSNAVKFTSKGDRITISLRCVNSHIEIQVSDTGEGIQAKLLPHLFERFRQGDASSRRVHSGLGIGLALVKHLSELHGGTVSAASPGHGKGATFTVTFPPAIIHALPDSLVGAIHPLPPAQRDSGGLPSMPGRPDLNGVRVLVVEDEPDTRSFLEALLERSRMQVHGAASAKEALREIMHFRPHVIVSDIGMPHMDGYQFMEQLRRRSPAEGGATPAVALTAFARPEDRTRALMAGYQTHIAKPAEPAELLATIAALASQAPN